MIGDPVAKPSDPESADDSDDDEELRISQLCALLMEDTKTSALRDLVIAFELDAQSGSNDPEVQRAIDKHIPEFREIPNFGPPLTHIDPKC